MSPAALRLGIAREFFFENLDPEIARAMNQALPVLEKLAASVKEVVISARTQEQLRSTVRLAEAYAYHAKPFDVYGWPTISVPCGFSASGLPIGLQMSVALGQDAIVLQLAHAYEQATDWHIRKPLGIG